MTGSTKNFTAVEGQNTGPFVLATFTDPNTLATVADVTATLAIGGWGDGTPTRRRRHARSPADRRQPSRAQQSATRSSRSSAATPTPRRRPPASPDTLSVDHHDLGGVTTTLTSPPGGGVTVLDAPLSSSNGTEITGIEGISTGTVLLGTFTDANQAATVADYTTRRRLGRRQLGRRLGSADPGRQQPHCERHAQRRHLDHQRRPHLHRGGNLRLHGHGDR